MSLMIWVAETDVYVVIAVSDRAENTGWSKKMDGIWNRYNLKSTGRIYTFPQTETFEQQTVSRVIFM